MRRLLFLFCFLVQGLSLIEAAPGPSPVSFIENKRQWPRDVAFKAELPTGNVYLKATGWVFDWWSQPDLAAAYRAAFRRRPGTLEPLPAAPLRGHAVFVDFVGAQADVQTVGTERLSTLRSYFVGPESARWASRVASFARVHYRALYPGIELLAYGTAQGRFKYDFVVTPGAAPGHISLRYRGATALAVQPDGALRVSTSVQQVQEQRPYAFQLVDGVQRPVPCRYRLHGNVVSYEFPQGYDATRPLVIDPEVVAATFSGAAQEGTLGAAATSDNAGYIYTAGVVRNGTVPTTPGAYQTTFRGVADIGISKYSPNGGALLQATYLGGSSLEDPHVVRVAANGDVYTAGITASHDYPVTAGCYDAVLNGTPNQDFDLVVSRVSADATRLLASTYLGGASFDRVGDLQLTAAGHVVLTGWTASPDFPTTAGALDRSFRGAGTGFVTRLDASMQALHWSTLLGGNRQSQGVTLVLAAGEEPVVAGNTSSTDFPAAAGGILPAPQGGSDAFLVRLRANGQSLAAATLFGAPDNLDCITALALDASGAVLAGGYTWGTLPASPGTAFNGSGQGFLTKFTPDLRSRYFTAVLPCAFFGCSAVGFDACGNVLAAGAVPRATPSVSLPVVNPLLPLVNAQINGNYNYFLYLFALNPTGTQQLFGSYFGPGGPSSGVQTIDARGNLYHGFDTYGGEFPPTAWAYSRTSTAGYDGAVIKVDMNTTVAVRAGLPAPPSGCAPYQVAFGNNSVGAARYSWDFGDGSAPDTARTPRHLYRQPGTYRVRLVATAPAGQPCQGATRDTATATVQVVAPPVAALPDTLTICPGSSSVRLQAGGGANATFRWNTGATTAAIDAPAPGRYSVVVSNGLCSVRDSVEVRPMPDLDLGADTLLCGTDRLTLRVPRVPGATVRWSTQETTSAITVSASGVYSVTINLGGCSRTAARRVTFVATPKGYNIITPNGDGLNDTFQPTPLLAGTRLTILSRWGREVFRSDNYQNDWSAAGLPAGTYYYVLDNPLLCNPHLKGWVEVVQ